VPTHRCAPDGSSAQPWSPSESVTVEESLRSYTENVAYQMQREDQVGVIALGYRADFVVLSKNPLTSKPEEISSIEVVATYKDGVPLG
ncbi:MAG: amidohydrolase family protein, partial [Candidatus Planktophila sp.]